MNPTVERIKKGQEVSTEEIFNIINHFNITSLYLKDGNNTFGMQINHFETYNDVFEFSQEYANENICIIKKTDIISVEAKWEKEIDCIIIKCQMSDNRKMHFTVYYVSKDFSISENSGYYETDVYSLYDFLEKVLHDEEKYNCTMVTMYDKFSVFLKMMYPEKVFIDTSDEYNCKLYIGDGINELNISVTDDMSNAFYRKDSDSSVEIIVKPYGQPFMEIKMLFWERKK